MAAAVSEREVQHATVAERSAIHHEAWVIDGPVGFGESSSRVAVPTGLEQRLDVPVVLAEIQFVVGVEWFDAHHEWVGFGSRRDGYGVRLDGGMRQKLAAERVGENVECSWRDERTLAESFGGRVDCGVRAMESEPSTAALHPIAQRMLHSVIRPHVARV